MDDKNPSMNEELADSIAMLEQILEVMPNDPMALRALYDAYCQCAMREKAFDYLRKLSGEAAKSGDAQLRSFCSNELPTYDDINPSEVTILLAEIQTSGEADADESVTEQTTAHASEQTEAEITEELALAWQLYEDNQLSQEEYSTVLHDLTEVSSKEIGVPVSVQHVLNDRGFTQINRVMNHISSRSGTPCISLLNFELTEDVVRSLPIEMASKEGALPFGFFGNDLLIAVLNPFNHALVEKVEKEAGKRCHAYLVSAEDYDTALKKLKDMAA